ncbi:MAG: FAD-dependent monooxygenase, partial [Pseudomonadota bacterium]
NGPLAWNLLNVDTLRLLWERIAQLSGIKVLSGSAFSSMVQRDREVIARLTCGTSVRARLVAGLDGRDSAVRDAAGISAHTTRYGQTALAFVVSHPVPHENISTEIYHCGGPFTTVPLPDQASSPASAVVWMNEAPYAKRLLAMEKREFEEVATARSAHWLGPLTLQSARRPWPIITRKAGALTSHRTAVLAEAAHVVPPIGAQGLNTSLNDVAALADALTDVEDPGAPEVLRAYDRSRRADIAARVAAIDLFNRVTRSSLPWLQSLRLNGLKAVADTSILRRTVMRAGMGNS